MERSVRRLGIVAVGGGGLVLLVGAAVWVGAVERWLGHELRALAAAHLVPAFDFDDLTYTLPSTVTLRGVRLTSPDPDTPAETLEILAMDSLTLELTRIPQPHQPFRMQRLDFTRPVLRFVRIREGGGAERLLGFSDLLRGPTPATAPTASTARPSDFFQVRRLSVGDGSVQFDPRDGSAALMLIDGITARLALEPSGAGAYAIAFSLDRHPLLTLALRGELLVDDERLGIDTLSLRLQLSREQDHFLPPRVQKLLVERDITGLLSVDAAGALVRDDASSSHLQADFELSDAHYAVGSYGLSLDHVESRISVSGGTLTVEDLAIDALGGHVGLGSTLELDSPRTGALRFEGADLRIGDLLRGAGDPAGRPAFSGLLDFSGTLRGPFAEIGRRARGSGRLSLRKARLARLPVLSTIDEALDRTAEAVMKREHRGHDVLSLGFSFDGDHAHIEKLRMNSRWYGLRGHGDLYFDSRLDLALDGGPVQRVENELGALGDVMGEITETLLRARITGTLAQPRVGIEVLRAPLRPHGAGGERRHRAERSTPGRILLEGGGWNLAISRSDAERAPEPEVPGAAQHDSLTSGVSRHVENRFSPRGGRAAALRRLRDDPEIRCDGHGKVFGRGRVPDEVRHDAGAAREGPGASPAHAHAHARPGRQESLRVGRRDLLQVHLRRYRGGLRPLPEDRGQQADRRERRDGVDELGRLGRLGTLVLSCPSGA